MVHWSEEAGSFRPAAADRCVVVVVMPYEKTDGVLTRQTRQSS